MIESPNGQAAGDPFAVMLGFPSEQRGDAWEPPAARSLTPITAISGTATTMARTWPRPKLASELAATAKPVRWLWRGFLASGHITLFSAIMKSGKSTLIAHALRALQSGGLFLEADVSESKTLIVSEESETIWHARVNDLGLADHLAVLSRPFVAKPNFADWNEFVEHILECAERHNADLIVLDTIGACWPVKDENDAAQVQGALTPLNRLTKDGKAVMLVHHIGKADAGEGRAARGSTALAGFVDILIELRRFAPNDRNDRRRVLTGYGRFDDVPGEVVLELADDGSEYRCVGDRSEVADRDLVKELDSILPDDPQGMTADEIRNMLPTESRPNKSRLSKVLNLEAEAGRLRREGKGAKGCPFRFYKGEATV